MWLVHDRKKFVVDSPSQVQSEASVWRCGSGRRGHALACRAPGQVTGRCLHTHSHSLSGRRPLTAAAPAAGCAHGPDSMRTHFLMTGHRWHSVRTWSWPCGTVLPLSAVTPVPLAECAPGPGPAGPGVTMSTKSQGAFPSRAPAGSPIVLPDDQTCIDKQTKPKKGEPKSP